MKQKTKGVGNQSAGRDIDNRVSLDLRITQDGVFDQRISIGTVSVGPIHIHLSVDAQGNESEINVK